MDDLLLIGVLLDKLDAKFCSRNLRHSSRCDMLKSSFIFSVFTSVC